MKVYKRRFFKEDFLTKDINRAVKLIGNIIARKLGTKINWSDLAGSFIRSGSEYTGQIGIMDDGRALRLNWKYGDNSGKLVSIDYWKKAGAYPDMTISVRELNIVQAITQIIDIIQKGEFGIFVFNESKGNKYKKVKIKERTFQKAVSESINGWIKKLHWIEETDEINSYRLENNRFSELYRDYQFWFKEYGKTEGYKLVSDPVFREFLGQKLPEHGINNIFSKTVKVGKAGKSTILVDKKQEEKFNAEIYEMSLDEVIDQIKAGVRTVAKGIKTARLITGTAGAGKSKHVFEELQSLGYSKAGDKLSPGSKQFKEISGDIKKPRALYQTLYDWNDPNCIIVFDDVNGILKDKGNIELLRKAVTNDKVREIFYTDDKIQSGNRKYKPMLEFESRIIIITNIPKKKIDNAIVSRTAPIEAIVDFDQMADAIMRALPSIEPEGFLQEKEDVFNFIVYEVGKKNVDQFDFRIFQDCLMWRASESPYWKKYCYGIIKKS